jgi:hypothetical protein
LTFFDLVLASFHLNQLVFTTFSKESALFTIFFVFNSNCFFLIGLVFSLGWSHENGRPISQSTVSKESGCQLLPFNRISAVSLK